MLRKRIYRIWLGPLPAWTPQFLATVERLKQFGWDFVIKNDPDELKWRCRKHLGIAMNAQPGTRKAGDYDPCIGVLFADELKTYDFWGHCGLDVVFGRVDRFLPDAFLRNVDIFGNDPDAICGPFSVYRNSTVVNTLYESALEWRHYLEEPDIQAFDEDHMTRVVRIARNKGLLNFWSGFQQGHDKQAWHLPNPVLRFGDAGAVYDCPLQDDPLWKLARRQFLSDDCSDDGTWREIMMFHFNRKDRPATWPQIRNR